jgi:hypothetical protein
MRIEIIDTSKQPAVTYYYESPFKSSSYRVESSGAITLTIIKPLNLLTYDVDNARKVSSIRKCAIKIYEEIGGEEYLIRSFDANFKFYLLEERPLANGDMEREEHIIFEILTVH